MDYAKTLPPLPDHRLQVGKGAKVARQTGLTTAVTLLKLAANHVCYACGSDVHRDANNWLQCDKGCKGGAFYLNDGSGLLHRMVDGLRYHNLKEELLKTDSCTSGLPLLEFTAYGKSSASMQCIKCKASVSRKYVHDGVNFDLEGSASTASGRNHGLNFDD